MLRQRASGYISWDVIRTEPFFAGYFELSHTHTHPHTQSTYIVLLWGLVPPFCWTLEGTWVNILFLFCFFHITIYLWIDHEVNISSYWCMEFHGDPPIFPSFLPGLPCFISFLQRSWSPLKSWVFPLHPGAKQRIRCGSPKFFFWGGGGQPRSVTVLVLVFGFFLFLGLRILGVGVRTGGCWMLLGSGLMSPAQGWEIWALKSPKS